MKDLKIGDYVIVINNDRIDGGAIGMIDSIYLNLKSEIAYSIKVLMHHEHLHLAQYSSNLSFEDLELITTEFELIMHSIKK